MKRASWALAAAFLAAPLDAQPTAPQDPYRAAVAARQEGNPQRAADLLAPVVASDPANADAQVQLGYALLALDRLDESERAFRAALAVAPDYADASLGLERIVQRRSERGGLTRWSLDVDGNYSAVDGAQADWREATIQLRYRASAATAISARLEAARRFGTTDVYGEVGIQQALSGRARAYLTVGATPDADFRPRYQIGAGGSFRIRQGGDASVLTLDARQADFAAGDVQAISPGIEQYLAGGRIWLTARWIHLFDEDGDHQAGHLFRADGEATDRLRLFVGLSDAPDTSEGIVVDTRSYFGGASYDLDRRTTLRLSVAHEDRDTGADRTQLGVGLGLRF
jgi:YaiO family outer membrane protein